MPGVTNVLEPTPGDGNLVAALNDKGYKVTAAGEFWEEWGHFDAVVMNPPFNKGHCNIILEKVMLMTDHIVAVMPVSSLTSSWKRAAAITKFGLARWILLPRLIWPGTKVNTSILVMSRGWKYTATVSLLPEHVVDEIRAINKEQSLCRK